jgi:hypothetical protein
VTSVSIAFDLRNPDEALSAPFHCLTDYVEVGNLACDGIPLSRVRDSIPRMFDLVHAVAGYGRVLFLCSSRHGATYERYGAARMATGIKYRTDDDWLMEL